MKNLYTKLKENLVSIAILFIALFTSLIILIQKITFYISEPEKEKDCLPDILPSLLEMQQLSDFINIDKINGTINDASCLNRTGIYGIVKIKNEDDLRKALDFAKQNKKKISIAGVQHSMGGQAFAEDNLVLDMNEFNKFSINPETKILTAQSGARWKEIQEALNEKGLAVKAMQSTNIFTLGGTISVNAHGIDHQIGSVASTVKSLRIMMADGSIQNLSSTENPELFNAVIGGYGLFGIILDARIEVTTNDVYVKARQTINYAEIPEIYEVIKKNDSTKLMYVDLSITPNSLLNEGFLYTYNENKSKSADATQALADRKYLEIRRFLLNISKESDFGKNLRWFVQKYIEPTVENCNLNRNEAISESEACFISRNEEMHDSFKYTKDVMVNETDILQEYFVSKNNFVNFVDGMRKILVDEKANLLNASVRFVHKEPVFLNYSNEEDMLSVVIYVHQAANQEENQKMEKVTKSLIDLSIANNGTFFLPYQLNYSKEQLKKAYPQIDAFFELKKKYDSDEVFTNKFYLKYSR